MTDKSDPLIGQHCSLEECNTLDFLPFICIWCRNIFCLEHRSVSTHKCSECVDKVTPSVSEHPPHPRPESESSPCHLSGCQRRGVSGSHLPRVTCPHCHNTYCMGHRLCRDHHCTNDPTIAKGKPELSDKAKQLLQNAKESSEKLQHRATSKMTAVTAVGSGSGKSSELARKVLVMKLKQRAIGDTGIPGSERLYVDVALPAVGEGGGSKSVAVFVSRRWSVGKAIDNIAALTSTRNDNTLPSAKKLRLFHATGGRMLPCDATLDCLQQEEEEEEDPTAACAVTDGHTLILEYT